MGANQDENNAAVTHAIGKIEYTLRQCRDMFRHIERSAQGNKRAIEDVHVIEQSFFDAVRDVTTWVKKDYDEGKITAEIATLFLSKAEAIAYRVSHQNPIDPELFKVFTSVNIDAFKSKLAYKKARDHAIMGLITTMAIVGAVAISLALAGPSMGASLLLLLPLALSGAGCGIPRALEGRRLHFKSESDEASITQVEVMETSGYAKHLEKAYAALRPDDKPDPHDGEEHKDSPSLP